MPLSHFSDILFSRRLSALSCAALLTAALCSAGHSSPLHKHVQLKVKPPELRTTTLPVHPNLPTTNVVGGGAASAMPFNLLWDADTQGNFIMSMTGDLQGHIWVGTEDQGLWRFDRSAPSGKQWTQFNSKNGLGDDNCYALTCDRLGRIGQEPSITA